MLKWIKNSKTNYKNKTSKYRGVTWNKNANKYHAYLYFRQGSKEVRVDIGLYKTEKEAMKARINYILNLF